MKLFIYIFLSITLSTLYVAKGEPTNASEAASQKEKANIELDKKYQAYFDSLNPSAQAWEKTLQSELGGFYLPIHKKQKVAGQSNAWDYIKDNPKLPRVLLIGDSVSRAYTQTVRKELKGIANVHRAPANCGPTATGIKKIDLWLGKDTWDLIHFNFGIHDRKTSQKDYRERLNSLLQTMKKRSKQVVWANTTPIPDLPSKGQTFTSIIDKNKIAAAVMKKNKIETNDLFNAVLPHLSKYQRDKDVHFHQPGNEFLGKQVAKFIKAQLNTYKLSARASHIDTQAKEYKDIKFIFTDAKNKVRDLQHAIVNTSSPSKGQLVIWLMGHNRELFTRLANYGYHAIQPHYANGWFSTLSPKQLKDGTSIGNMRLEAATGEDFSPIMNINKRDGMKERCRQFILWLMKENPQGKWEQFLTADQQAIIWDKVIMGGISHGSTTAARFSKHQKVARVVMLSGPRDQHETWHGFPSKTPSNRLFGFTHVLDTGWEGDHYCRSWLMLGLEKHGSIVNVDEVPAPFNHSRRLITNGDVMGNSGRAHTCVQPGGTSVKDENGNYLHESVWEYIFTHPVDQVGESISPETDCLMEHP